MLFSFPKGLWVKLFFGNCVTRRNLGAYGFLERTGLTGNNSFQKESSCLLFPKAPFNQILNTKTLLVSVLLVEACVGLQRIQLQLVMKRIMKVRFSVFPHSGEQALRDLKKKKRCGKKFRSLPINRQSPA